MALRRATAGLALLGCVLAPGWVNALEPAASWAHHLQTVDLALARGDISAAVQEWHQGFAAALRGRTWLGLVEVGDAYLRIAEVGGFRGSAKPMARHLYLEALVQAKSQRSPEGALRVAAAFARLGDRGVVEQCVRVAESAARRQRDAHAMHEVAAARERLALTLVHRREGKR